MLGWVDPLQKGMAPHSSILAWRIPWTEEPGGLQSRGSQVSDTTEALSRQLTFGILVLPTRDWIHAPFNGSADSYLLDHQGSAL